MVVHGTWEELKKKGNERYKTGEIEPIDLYRSAGMLRHFVLGSIIKYAFRNADSQKSVSYIKDLRKIIHYAELLIAEHESKISPLEEIWPEYKHRNVEKGGERENERCTLSGDQGCRRPGE